MAPKDACILGRATLTIVLSRISSIATNITVTDESSDTLTFPLFVTASVSGGLVQTANLEPQAGSNLSFNSSTGQLTASSFLGNVTGNATGLSGTPSITVQDVTAQMVSVAGTMQYEDVVNVDSAGIGTFKGGLDVVGSAVTIHNAGVHVTGVVTATSFVGDGSSLTNLPGNPFTDNVGVQTANITRTDLVGAGNSFVGMYLGDGFIGFPTHLGRPGGYYITTAVNALNAGPITLGSTMTLDGAWVIV